jgi:hypothetical protein
MRAMTKGREHELRSPTLNEWRYQVRRRIRSQPHMSGGLGPCEPWPRRQAARRLRPDVFKLDAVNPLGRRVGRDRR